MKKRLPTFHFSVLLFALALHISVSVAQDQWGKLKFQRFGVDQGLSVTTAFNIVQDDLGFLWIATIDGLQRYDGYSFVAFKNNFNDSTSLSDNTVSTIAKGKGNVLWVGTYSGGLNRLDINSGKFRRFQNDPADKNTISSNRIWAIYEDDKGKVWIGTDDGLNCFDPVSNRIFRYHHDEHDLRTLAGNSILSIHKDRFGMLYIGTTNGLSLATPDEEGRITSFYNYRSPLISNNIVMSLCESKDGKIWVGTSDGLNRFEKTESGFHVIRFSENKDSGSVQVYSYLNSYGNNAIRAIHEDKFGNLWLCTDKGLKILDPETEKFTEYHPDPNDPTTLSADLLYGFCEDRSGNLWIGTMVGGLNKTDLKPKKFKLTQTQNGNPAGLSRNNIRSIFVDSKNTLWVGTLEGGLNRMDAGTGKFQQVKDPNCNSANFWCIYEDKKGMMWFGSSDGLISYDREKNMYTQYRSVKGDENTLSDDIVRSIHEDRNGSLWIGTEGGLNRFDPRPAGLISIFDAPKGRFYRYIHDEKNKGSLSSNTVWTIKENDGTLWVGTDNGLNKFIENIQTFEHFYPERGNKNSLSNKSIRSIWIDKDGILWLGTSNGLNKLDPKTNVFTRFSEENGLANAYIYGVLGDEKGRLWISTNNGVSRFNIAEGKFKNYDKLDGLQNNEFNTGAYHKSAKGEFFFGGPDGFNSFFPDSLAENKTPPPIAITSIKVLGIELQNEKQPYALDEIRLDYYQNVIAFEFAALDFTIPEKNEYLYKLEGFDKDWIDAGSRRFVSYTNLDPGKYKFKVRASNSDGTWNDTGVEIRLSIVPPFWKTWWFQLFAATFIVIGVYTYVKRRIRRIKENEERLEIQVELKTKELRREKELVDKQNLVIEKKNHSITSSIRYAKRIQDSILPLQEKFNELIPDSFIFFKPKDIVSGDFYWFTKQHNRILFAAVDCTGHGVPGAFMSLIGNNLLNDAVKNQHLLEPDRILHKVHEGLVKVLKKGEQQSDTVDGMDIILCILDRENHLLEFSSTGRPLIQIRDGEVRKYRVGKHPLGLITKKEVKLETKRIPIQSGDSFYIFTDGYCDQFGGDDDDKYMDENFEKFLVKIQDQKMNEQMISIEKEINDWKGDCPQIDDMLVIGIRC